MRSRRLLVTGSRGFIGKNLVLRPQETCCDVVRFDRGDSVGSLPDRLDGVDAVVHLAGENRPAETEGFITGNTELTESLCRAMEAAARHIPLIFASSRYAAIHDSPEVSEFHRRYGESKHRAEQAVEDFTARTGSPAAIYRLPGVFGKWCRPHYNSVVATFCHNIAQDLPIHVSDPAAPLQLVYVDDVVTEFLSTLEHMPGGLSRRTVAPEYHTTLGALAESVQSFRRSRTSLTVDRVGAGLTRALYATYVSYLRPTDFSYTVPRHGDARGVFAELVKTVDSGQFSFFTAHPGVTRGGHYHHTKTEKFVVVRGHARFRFRHLLTGEQHQIETSGDAPCVVETVPGWAHDISNIGADEMVVMLWANEVFDQHRPDTINAQVES